MRFEDTTASVSIVLAKATVGEAAFAIPALVPGGTGIAETGGHVTGAVDAVLEAAFLAVSFVEAYCEGMVFLSQKDLKLAWYPRCHLDLCAHAYLLGYLP